MRLKLFAFLVLWSSCAWAQREPMKFVVTPSRIYAYGEITEDTVAQFKQLATLNPELPKTIRLWSYGGTLGGAFNLGVAIHKLKFNTEVAPIPIDLPYLKTVYCTSACVFVLMGGIQRVVSTEAKIGVHRGAYPANTPRWSYEDEQAAFGRQIEYVRFMGIDMELLQVQHSVPNSEMRFLTHSTLRDWKVTTGPDITDYDPILMGNYTPH